MRRKLHNPSGQDVIGFLVGFVLPFGVGAFTGSTPLVAAGESALAGTTAAIVGADKPGFFRGATVGAAAAFGVTLVAQIVVARSLAKELAAAQAAAAARPQTQV